MTLAHDDKNDVSDRCMGLMGGGCTGWQSDYTDENIANGYV